MHILHTMSIIFKLKQLYLTYTYLLQDSGEVPLSACGQRLTMILKSSFLTPVFSTPLVTFPTENVIQATIKYT
jgi:hypothetical protein